MKRLFEINSQCNKVTFITLFLVCNHVTRQPCCCSQYNRIFSQKIYMKIETYTFQRRKMLLFLTTNMDAHTVTSHATSNNWVNSLITNLLIKSFLYMRDKFSFKYWMIKLYVPFYRSYIHVPLNCILFEVLLPKWTPLYLWVAAVFLYRKRMIQKQNWANTMQHILFLEKFPSLRILN